MANKSRKEKKKRAKTKKREKDLLSQKVKKPETEELAEAKRQGESEAEALGNDGAPKPAEVNEDAGKDIATVKATEFYAPMKKGAELGLKRVEEMDIEEPFDPKKLIADILKKKEGDK